MAIYLHLAFAMTTFFGVAPSEERPATSIASLQLKDTSGKEWSLGVDKKHKAVVVVFLGTQCPINNAYLPRLIELHTAYAKQGVGFFAINANESDTPKAIAQHAKQFKLSFPVLRDEKHRAADAFKAERTPEAFVLDGERAVRYRGRIDDQFGVGFQRPQPTRRDLAEALDELLAGTPVTQARTAVAGCLITRAPRPKKDATVTYAKHVSRIMQKHCQECHRPGQIAPMPLLSYEDASSWAAMIREVVSENRMPPWHADPKHGKFRNDRSLTQEERAQLLAWIEQGSPKGDDKKLPEPRTFADTWNIGKPDAVFHMTTEFKIPAKAPKGGIPYKYFLVKTNFEQDMWVRAAEARPGNRAVVHHIIVYVRPGDGTRPKDMGDTIGNGLLATYAPGDLGTSLPEGYAKKIPKGGQLIFQMHYTPSGVEQTDRSSVGLVFSKEPPKQEVKTRAIAQQLLLIPPETASHKVTASRAFAKDALILGLFPHMHLRGKSFEFQAIYPDGKKEVLLSVPRYDFGWQSNYFFEKPLRVPAGTKIECTALFDNSKDNPNNPDPSRWVHWGDQTWEEMMIGFLDYTYIDTELK